MERQKREGARGLDGLGRSGDGGGLVRDPRQIGATEFLGYDTETAAGEIVRARAGRQGGRRAEGRRRGAQIVVNHTPFYAETGGQVGDHGVIRGAKGALFRVTDTQKQAGDLFVHLGKVESGQLQGRRRRRARGRSRQPHGAPAPTTRRPTCCTRRCARCWARTSRRRARWSRPTGCASTSRTPSR